MNELETKIVEAAEAYYNGNAIMADSAFDELVEQLREINPESEILNSVGWGISNEMHLEKFKHSKFIGGLNEIKIGNIQRLPEGNQYTISDKLDGITGVAYYKNGNLERVLTRFNGQEGLDITKNLEFCNIPKVVSSYVKSVRGEIVINRKLFEEHLSKDYANERNAAAGFCNSKNLSDEDKKLLSFVAYDIPEISFAGIEDHSKLIGAPVTKWDKLKRLQLLGFEVVRHQMATTREEAIKVLQDFDVYARSDKYLLDGAVIDTSPLETFKIKYPATLKEVEVVGVEWNCSTQGRLIPVIKTVPIELDGAIVSRFSGFNWHSIVGNGIGAGAIIKVCRSNMVIPHWHSTIKPAEKPDVPEIWEGKPTYSEGVHLNVVVDIRKPFIFNLLNKNKVDGIGGTALAQLVKCLNIKNPLDLIKISRAANCKGEDKILHQLLKDEVGNGYRYKGLLETLRNIIHTKYSLADILCMANLKGLGYTASWIIAENLDVGQLAYELKKYGELPFWVESKLPTYVPGVSVKENHEFLLELIDLGLDIVDYEPEPVIEAALKVCATGTLSMTRSKLFEMWSRYGIVETDAGKADVLVCSGEGSSKWKTAMKRGIPILTEEEFNDKYLQDKAVS